jgi:hypothetical protein
MFLGDLTHVHVEWCSRELVIRQTTAAPRAEGEKAYICHDRIFAEPDQRGPMASSFGFASRKPARLFFM